MSNYNRLQSDSHFRRRKNLEELHSKYVHFALNECYPNLLQVFNDYNSWISQRSIVIQQFQSIKQSYDKQCEDIVNYVDMIDDLRTTVYKNIRKLSESSSTGITNEYFPVPHPPSQPLQTHPYQTSEDDASHQQHMSSGDDEVESTASEPTSSSNKTLMKKLRGTTKRAILQTEEGFLKLDSVIRQIRTNMHKK